MRSLLRIFKTALRGLRSNVLRSALTCLGIIIGIGAVIAMVEIGRGSNHAIEQTIASIGASVVQIDPSDAVKAAVSSGMGGRITLTPDDADAIYRECSAVRYAAPSVDCRAQVIYGSRNWSPRKILGTTPDYLRICNWSQLKEGASFTDDDVRSAACVCLIGDTPAGVLFGNESPVGKEIRIKNVRMRILGVLAKKGANMMGSDQDDFLIAPWTTVKYRLSSARDRAAQTPAAPTPIAGVQNTLAALYPSQSAALYPDAPASRAADTPMLSRFPDLDDIWVSASSSEEVPQAIRQITSLLRQRHRLSDNEPDDFRIRDLTEISQTLASTSALMTRLLLSVALISLIVGGVGIMNIMLVSVTERTREIGLRMAVGARGRDIMRQFLVEAVMLCLAGGVVGILLGRGASLAITALLKWPTMPSLPAVIAAVAVSAGVGMIFGFYPAWKASRLDPIEALRFE
jgi:ABC-type antimicrobial peptide transport system permease subunit